MRDYSTLCASPSPEATFKEVVIIGNGPAGLAASYLLSGMWPHFRGSHPDHLLEARLMFQRSSIIQQDLAFLSQGLEGRSRNPVSNLMDTLMHPGADQGNEDQAPVLEYRQHEATDHVVIGRAPPGGTWQNIPGETVSLSLSSWMELPGYELRTWAMEAGRLPEFIPPQRVRAKFIAQYYTDYVTKHRLWKYQRRGEISSVRFCDEDCEVHKGPVWRVEGKDSRGRSLNYMCRNLILATGTSDIPNRLGVEGEDGPQVHHNLRSLEAAMCELHPQTQCEVVIVGSGLSAADAVLTALRHNLRVAHVFRNRPTQSLPQNVYPEYHKVERLMSGEKAAGYRALEGHRLVALGRDFAQLEAPHGSVYTLTTCLTGIFIGSKPNLDFLACRSSLTVYEDRELDSRTNPIEVDPWTHEVVKAPPRLYALGPLAGDNFVRFLIGGAVAAVSDIVRRRR